MIVMALLILGSTLFYQFVVDNLFSTFVFQLMKYLKVMELENEIHILKKSFKDNEELITQQLELEYLSLQMREILENLS